MDGIGISPKTAGNQIRQNYLPTKPNAIYGREGNLGGLGPQSADFDEPRGEI
jgi:hypothetical protein